MSSRLPKKKLYAWKTLLHAQAVLFEQIDSELSRAGALSMQWYDLLYALYLAPQRRLRFSELAAAVLLSRSGVTRLATRLEKAGLLRREDCPSDRRGTYAALTEKGLVALRQTWPVYEAQIAERFGDLLQEDEIEPLTQALERVTKDHRKIR